MVNYDILIDFNKPITNQILVKRGDDKSRVIVFTFLSNGTQYLVSQDDIASLRAILPDGTNIYADCAIREDGKVEYTLTENMLAQTGKVVAEISIFTASGATINSFEFYIVVEAILYNEQDYMSDEDLQGFKDYLNKARVAAVSAEEAEEGAIQAKEESEAARDAAIQVKVDIEESIDEAKADIANTTEAAKTIIYDTADDAKQTVIQVATDVQTYVEAANDRFDEVERTATSASETATLKANEAATSAGDATNRANAAAASAAAAQTALNEVQNQAEIATTAATQAIEAKDIAVTSAEEASVDATNALASSVDAFNSADAANNYCLRSQSYAVGTDNSYREGDATDNAKYYYEKTRAASQGGTSGGLIPVGTIVFEELPALSVAEIGWMYNISNAFVTTAAFADGAGIPYPAGTNVYKISETQWDCLAGMPMIVDQDLDAASNNAVANAAVTAAITDINTELTTQSDRIDYVNTELGNKANTADLATVATSGRYSDLTGTPETTTAVTAGSTALVTSGAVAAALGDKPSESDLATVAKTGSYADLLNKPTISNTIATGSSDLPTAGAVAAGLAAKANTSHASTLNTFGLGTKTLYGHTKIVDDLTELPEAYVAGEALSSHAGTQLLKEIANSGKEISWADYQALPEAEKKNGTTYFVPDKDQGETVGSLSEKVADLNSNLANGKFKVRLTEDGKQEKSFDGGLTWENFSNGGEAELLWSNPSPTVAFSPQTINENSNGWVSGMSLADYDYVLIEVKQSWNVETRGITLLSKGTINGVANGDATNWRKIASISDSGIAFSNGGYSGNSDNSCGIPTRIWGCKSMGDAPKSFLPVEVATDIQVVGLEYAISVPSGVKMVTIKGSTGNTSHQRKLNGVTGLTLLTYNAINTTQNEWERNVITGVPDGNEIKLLFGVNQYDNIRVSYAFYK